MAILTIEEVKTAFKLPDHSDVDDAVGVALISAKTYFEGVLVTPFDYVGVARTDVFKPDAIKFPLVSDGFFRLHLRQAFLWPAADYTVAVEVADDPLTGTYEAMAATDYFIDRDKGIVKIRYADPREDYEIAPRRLVQSLNGFTSYDKQWVRVSYKAGFNEVIVSPATPAHAAPEWLKQAFLVYMAPTLSLTNVEEHKDTSPRQTTDNVRLAATMIEPYMRGKSQAVYPVPGLV